MIKDLFYAGVQKQLDKATEAESKKVGILRGGNTGMINSQGTIIGSCPAQTYLRYKGVNVSPVTINKELMFAGGRLNEEHWLSVMTDIYTEGPILCEEEIPTYWETSNGTPVTGRPDMVLCYPHDKDTDPKPRCLIELKQAMSVNSAYNVQIKREPQTKHVLQTVHYMHALGCEGELWYTNRTNFDMPGWMEYRPFPPPPHELLNYRFYRYGDINPKTGKPKKHQITEAQYIAGEFDKMFYQASKILPFVQGFNIKIDNKGTAWYRDVMEEDSEWMETIVTVEGIKRYYEYITEIESGGVVPKPAKNLTVLGEKSYDLHLYSDLGMLDPYYQQGRPLEEWISLVKNSLSK